MNDSDYDEILQQAVAEIRVARTLIAKQVNSAANSVYWNIGKLLFERQLEEGYGSGVVKQLSIDLKNEFHEQERKRWKERAQKGVLDETLVFSRNEGIGYKWRNLAILHTRAVDLPKTTNNGILFYIFFRNDQ